MESYPERLGFLKQLYERKFYEGATPKGALEKVISFQKKMHEFKISKAQSGKYANSSPPSLLDDDTQQYRPMTNYSSTRSRRERNVSSLESRKNEGPATSELRLILDRKPTGQLNILTENMRNRNLYSMHENRKKWKLLSHRESRPESSEQQSRLSRIDMTNFYRQHQGGSSERKVKPALIYKRTENHSIKENDEQSSRRSKTISKKVFIGGRDLEKAAEQYSKNYKEMNKNLENYEKELRKNKAKVTSVLQRRSFQKRKPDKKTSLNKAKLLNTNKQGKGNKTQPKHLKYDDFLFNLQLDPWNVADLDYA